MLCPVNDLMYYGRFAWIGSVGIRGERVSALEGPWHVLLLRLLLGFLLVSVLFGDFGLICNGMCYVQLSIYSTIYYTC